VLSSSRLSEPAGAAVRSPPVTVSTDWRSPPERAQASGWRPAPLPDTSHDGINAESLFDSAGFVRVPRAGTMPGE
jgi:hypothetical protein